MIVATSPTPPSEEALPPRRPFLVWCAVGNPMTLVFRDPIDLFSIAGTAFIVNAIAGDGETTWFEAFC